MKTDAGLKDLLNRLRRLSQLLAKLEAECRGTPELELRIHAMQANVKDAIRDVRRLLTRHNHWFSIRRSQQGSAN